jgi:hypothetical protein
MCGPVHVRQLFPTGPIEDLDLKVDHKTGDKDGARI